MTVDLSTLPNKTSLTGTEQLIMNDAGVAKDVSVDVLKAHVKADLAVPGGSALVGDNDGAGGSLWTTVRGFIARLLGSGGAALVGYLPAGTGAVATTVQSKLREIVSVNDVDAEATNTAILAVLSEAETGGSVVLVRSALLSRVPTMGDIVSAMRAGKVVNIVCYGDSTTDGNGTTGWVANPVSGGVPVGSIDHEATAPNAWPVRLKSILRDMFKNSNIHVWNAGYSGQKMNNGWALNNYDAAVTNNPAYGVPDVCFIGFGLNDVTETDVYASHLKQTLALCIKLISAGTLPVLLTCDAIQRNSPAERDSEEATQEVDSAKRTAAKQLGIPILDAGAAMRQWASCNSSGYTWVALQPDSLHFGDIGHSFKAGYVAASLFPDLIYSIDRLEVTAQDPRWQLNSSKTWGSYTGAYQKSGRNYYANSSTGDEELMRGWVWNDDPNLTLCNLLVSGGGQNSLPPRAKIELLDTVANYTRTKERSGVVFVSNTVLAVDLPMSLKRIPVGLSRIRALVKSGAASAQSYSSDLKFSKGSEHGALLNLRMPSTVVLDATNFGWYTSEQYRHDFEIGENVVIDVQAKLPIQSGVILWNCRGWDSAERWGPGTTQGLSIYRNSSTWFLTLAAGSQAGIAVYGFVSLATCPIADIAIDTSGIASFSVELTWELGIPIVAVKNQVGVVVMSKNLDGYDAAISGYLGGLVYRADTTEKPVIKEMSWGPL